MEPLYSRDTHTHRAPWRSPLTSHNSQTQFLEEVMAPKTKLGRKEHKN